MPIRRCAHHMSTRSAICFLLCLLQYNVATGFASQLSNGAGLGSAKHALMFSRITGHLNWKRSSPKKSLVCTKMFISPENIFQCENLFVIPFWLLMLVAPNSKVSYTLGPIIVWSYLHSADYQTSHEQLCTFRALSSAIHLAPCCRFEQPRYIRVFRQLRKFD